MDAARQMFTVILVLALLGAALWMLRRGAGPWRAAFQKGDPEPAALCLVGRVNLTPQHSVFILRGGVREWVLAVHPQGCTVISQSNAILCPEQTRPEQTRRAPA